MKRLIVLLIALFLTAGTSILRADSEVIESYTANLSERDHHASDGYKLTEAADILRQDRANYHKFHKRDEEDTEDKFFASEENRARIPELLRKGHNTPEILELIVKDVPIVRVTLMKGNDGLYLVVDNGD